MPSTPNTPAQPKNYASLAQLFQAFNNLKVLIVGDIMLDAYVYGQVNRISPEAPVPVVHVTRREQRLGGAANVALNLHALGATPILCSVIGNDVEGGQVLQLLKECGMTASGIIKSDQRITTVKERILAGKQQMLRVDTETTKPLSDLERKSLTQQIRELASEVDVVVFEDYDKGTLSKEVIEDTITFCNEHRIPTVVDPKKRNFLYYQGATLFKPNLKELREGLKVEAEPGNREQLQAAVGKLRQKMDFHYALVTLSEHGVYIQGPEQHHFIPAHVRRIADVSGAGDTVVSIAALLLALGMPAETIGCISNLGGGLVCEHIGVVPIDKAVLLAEAEKEGQLNLTAVGQ